MRSRWALPLVVVGLIVAACGGGGPDAGSLAEELSSTASGALEMRLVVSAGEAEAEGVGFELNGRYALHDGGLPDADLHYAGFAGDTTTSAQILATGDAAFLVLDGEAYELPASDSSAGAADPLAGIDIESWVEDPNVEDGESVDVVTGKVRADRALRDLFALAAGLDPETALPQGADADQLAAEVRSSSIELRVPQADREARTLHLDVVLTPAASDALQEALGAGGTLRVTFRLSIEPDEGRLQVEAPSDARPLSELSDAG